MKLKLSILAISSICIINSSYAQLVMLVPGFQPEAHGKMERIPEVVEAQDLGDLAALLQLVRKHQAQGTLKPKQKKQFQNHWTNLKGRPVRDRLGKSHKVGRNLKLNRTSSDKVLAGALEELGLAVESAQAKS